MYSCRKPPGRERFPAREFKEMSGPPKSCWQRMELTNVGSPKGREPYGVRVPAVVAGVTTCQGGREGRPQGRGGQVIRRHDREVCECREPKRYWVCSATVAGEACHATSCTDRCSTATCICWPTGESTPT